MLRLGFAPLSVVLLLALAVPALSQRSSRPPLSPTDIDAITRLVVLEALDSPDTWLSVSAAEGLGRFKSRADVVVPRLIAASAATRPTALRITALGPLTTLAAGAKGAPRAERPVRAEADDRRLVERWIVPDYNGAVKPRAVLTTPRGEIELELYPGDAPLGLDFFISVVESGEIVGTALGRVVRGMDVVDHLELGDRITGARMVR